MLDQDLSQLCPVWNSPCLKEKCISYESHTKQRFYNTKTQKYIPINQLEFYQDIEDNGIERRITIVRECRQLGKIIQIENEVDNFIPNTTENQ